MSTEKYQSYPQGKENIQTLDEEASELKSQAKTLKEDATEKIQEVKGKLQQKGHELQEKDENYPNADYQGQAPETIEREQFEETKAQSEQKKDKIINLAEKWVEKMLSAEITLEHDMRQKISEKISDLKENLIQKKEQLIRAEISLEHELTQKISEKVEDLKRSLIEKKDQLVRAEITLEHEVLQKVHLDPSQKKEQQQKYEQLSSQDADTTQPAEIDFRSAFSAQNPTLSTQFTQGFHSIMSTISQGVQTVKRKLSAATEAQYTRIKTTTSADEEEYPRTYHVGEEFREIIAGFSKIVDEDWQDERVDELRKVGVSENPFEPFGTKDIQVSGSLVGGDELVFKAQGVSSSRGLTERAGKDIERLDRQLNQVISGKGEEPGYQGFKDITNEISGKNQAIKEGGKGSLVSEDKKNLSGKGQGKAGNEKARVYESENMMNIA